MGSKTILVVEDDPDISLLLTTYLKSLGYRIQVASDGKAAVDLAQKELPDFIFLDIEIPFLSGFDVCKIVRNNPKTKDVPIVMLTSFSQIHHFETAFKLGANDYLTKPFDFDQLTEKIKKFMK